jgi:major membrane immunogen (membrane-anchored lipoprotein)
MDLTATTIGNYTFKPIGYDDDNNLNCIIENKSDDTIIQATYDFNQERLNVKNNDWMNQLEQKKKEEVCELIQHLTKEFELE